MEGGFVRVHDLGAFEVASAELLGCAGSLRTEDLVELYIISSGVLSE